MTSCEEWKRRFDLALEQFMPSALSGNHSEVVNATRLYIGKSPLLTQPSEGHEAFLDLEAFLFAETFGGTRGMISLAQVFNIVRTISRECGDAIPPNLRPARGGKTVDMVREAYAARGLTNSPERL